MDDDQQESAPHLHLDLRLPRRPLAEFGSAHTLILSGLEKLHPRTTADLPGLAAQLRSSGLPLIAIIDGPLVGDIADLALICHWRVGTRRSAFTFRPRSSGGFALSSPTLGEMIGKDRALELRLTGREVDALSAIKTGLLQSLVDSPPAAYLLARQLADQIKAASPAAIRLAIAAVEQGASLPLTEAFVLETDLFTRSVISADAREGVAAFFEKRLPRFTGR